MLKILLFPALIIFACFLAGLYGAIHNQISYTVSPEYFLSFKLPQMGIPDELYDRRGASLAGVWASWWLGPIIATPICLIGLRAQSAGQLTAAFLKSAAIVGAVTLIVGVGALFVSFFTITGQNVPFSALRPNVQDALAFARAGTMHNFSYVGGLVGMIVGCWFMWTATKQNATFS